MNQSFDSLCRDTLALDNSIRFVAIANKLGTVVAQEYRANLNPYLTREETSHTRYKIRDANESDANKKVDADKLKASLVDVESNKAFGLALLSYSVNNTKVNVEKMDTAPELRLNNSARVSLVSINPNIELGVLNIKLRSTDGKSFNLNIEKGRWIIDVPIGVYTLRADAEFSPGNGTAEYGGILSVIGEKNIVPIANAGEDKVVQANTSALLDGTNSYDPDGNISSYHWLQADGEPFITLIDTDTPSPSFIAPANLENDNKILFRLVVTDNDGSNSTDDVIVLIKNNSLLQKVAGTIILEPIPSTLSAGDFYDFKGILNLSYIADGSYVQIRNGKGEQYDELLTFAPVGNNGSFEAPWTAVPRDETLTIYAMYTDNSGNTFQSKSFPLNVMGFKSSPGASNQDSRNTASKTTNSGSKFDPFMEIHFSDWNKDYLNVYIVAIDSSSQSHKGEAERAVRDLEKFMEGRTGNNQGWNFNIIPTNGFPLPRQSEDDINILFSLSSIYDGKACGYSRINQRKAGEFVSNDISTSCGDVYGSTMHEFLHALGLGHTWLEGSLYDETGDMMCSTEWYFSTGEPTCDNDTDSYVDSTVPTEFNLRALNYTYGNNGFLEPNAKIKQNFNPQTDVKYYCEWPCILHKANIPPVSDAGKSQSAKSGTKVTLDGSKSFDSDGYITSYSWIQLSGPSVKLYSSATAKPYFYFPSGAYNTQLIFQLAVKDDTGTFGLDTVTVKPIFPDSEPRKQPDKGTTISPTTNDKSFSTNYYFISTIGFPGTGKGQVLEPTDISIIRQHDIMFVADKNNNRIQKFDTEGNYIASWGSRGSNIGKFLKE